MAERRTRGVDTIGVPCSTPAPDDDAGDLDGEDRLLCTVKPRVTTLPLVSRQVAGGTDRRPRRATLASPRGRQTGVGAARARSLLCTWCAWMVGLFPEPHGFSFRRPWCMDHLAKEPQNCDFEERHLPT
eukprot:scaffold32570_cov47-Phaeocystis_antarctica.AAC.2